MGITGERVLAIGNLSAARASRIIDATGLVVSPGFIDPHTHAIRGIFDVPNAESSLLQGVTTLTEGNDVAGVPGPGDIGIVRPGDTVAHSVLENTPVVVLTVWLPGGAAAPFHSP